MQKRRQINSRRGSSLRSTLAAASEPLRTAAWAVEERVLWPAADRLSPLLEVARWPLERVAWFLRDRLVWPLADRAAGYERGVAAGAVAVAAVGVAVLGVVMLPGGGDRQQQRLAGPAPAELAVQSSRPLPEGDPGPVLQGSPPSFAPTPGGASGADSTTAAGQASVAAASSLLGEEEGAAAASGKAVPAGPAAMRVARRFSEAFVRYEVGDATARTEQVFDETTTPRLATALEERPPRQPATVEVPRAKVLNLVPGPRKGKTYTVSASLLRVGLTSELRLEMRKRNGVWLITDVRG